MYPSLTIPVPDFLDSIPVEHRKDPHALLQILIQIQHAYHHVPKEAAKRLAEEMGVPLVRVQGLLSFYSFLSPEPQGDYVIHFSDNITDQMLGNRGLAAHLCQRLGVKLGETRKDGRVSVHFTSCTGMCDQGPAALVNYLPVTNLDQERIERIADLVNAQIPLQDWPPEFFTVKSQIRRSDVVFRKPIEPGEGIRASLERGGAFLAEWAEDLAPSDARKHHLERGGAETLKEIYRSELRGRGGAGFKTGIKWESVRDAKSSDHYVLCNADEGEPGTFKDRVLLTDYADMVFEGMTICGHAVGSKTGILYLRQEYWYMKEHLEKVLSRRREAGLLGKGILGTALDFDIELHFGAGAYICGMETAMIKSIEGRRGIPRRRWPLPVHQGYLRCPTVVNNVETFAAATVISAKGGAWFAHNGTGQSTGTKLFCVSGDCERPGIYEYPWGVSVHEVLRDCGALDAQGVQVGGPSGTMINTREFDRSACFEDLVGTGTLMIFGPQRDMFEAVKNFALFFQHESCGLCTPCRVGTTLLANYVRKFEKGCGSPVDLKEMQNISGLMKTMAHCGLGQTANHHITESIEKFPAIWKGRMKTTEFIPAFDLDGALEEARNLTGRTDPEAHLAPDHAPMEA
ncbi:MAG: NAD(P)H-dependent oxidoreductase subunit E [Holophagaceae bacterium]|nr:NAD(P)H-dependent oxidoreductase subunit E [Holophagaceae bacterium]